MTPYVLCGLQCVERVYRWAGANGFNGEFVEFVFEFSDADQWLLSKLMILSGYPAPVFKYKRDTNIRGVHDAGFIPLQAADLIAHDLFVATREASDDTERIALSHRMIENKPGSVGMITRQEVAGYIRFLVDTGSLGQPDCIL